MLGEPDSAGAEFAGKLRDLRLGVGPAHGVPPPPGPPVRDAQRPAERFSISMPRRASSRNRSSVRSRAAPWLNVCAEGQRPSAPIARADCLSATRGTVGDATAPGKARTGSHPTYASLIPSVPVIRTARIRGDPRDPHARWPAQSAYPAIRAAHRPDARLPSDPRGPYAWLRPAPCLASRRTSPRENLVVSPPRGLAGPLAGQAAADQRSGSRRAWSRLARTPAVMLSNTATPAYRSGASHIPGRQLAASLDPTASGLGSAITT